MYVCAKITVSGIVQGVGFRFYAMREAKAYGLMGYARNRTNGTVESMVEGPKSMIEEYIKSLRIGPAYSSVSGVDVEWLEYKNEYTNFMITG